MLTGIHFLLTYTCNFACDHCFLHCSPEARGTFTLDQVKTTLKEAKKTGTVSSVFFEGGEPLLYFPLLVESIRLAKKAGFSTGMVTNAYPAHCQADAALWLKPLKDAGLDFLSISNDSFHYGDNTENPAATALMAARQLELNTSSICIEQPIVEQPELETPPEDAAEDETGKGAPVVGGGARFRGRAAEKLVGGLPRRPLACLKSCPDEDLAAPSRVHVDAYGHVHLCQGISMGNMWETPLSKLIAEYRPDTHPVAG
ncbi:MAG TPA: hypothetical protein DHV36_05020, partial [Desulfobacteraceae bacterium]|nr:hypothetical protein [Desulfobacteraceae bacterium]